MSGRRARKKREAHSDGTSAAVEVASVSSRGIHSGQTAPSRGGAGAAFTAAAGSDRGRHSIRGNGMWRESGQNVCVRARARAERRRRPSAARRRQHVVVPPADLPAPLARACPARAPEQLSLTPALLAAAVDSPAARAPTSTLHSLPFLGVSANPHTAGASGRDGPASRDRSGAGWASGRRPEPVNPGPILPGALLPRALWPGTGDRESRRRAGQSGN